MIAYKLFRLRKNGTLGPLFINVRMVVPIGEWLTAECYPICEMCSIEYGQLDDGEIVLRSDLQEDGVIDQRTLYHEKQNRVVD